MSAYPLVCLYPEDVPDLQKVIKIAKQSSYNRVITRISNPALHQRDSGRHGDQRYVFTRSDLLLTGEQWLDNTILKIGEMSDCDSLNEFIRKQSNQNLKEEIDWAKYLNSVACIMVTLNNDESVNLGRQLIDNFSESGCVLAEIPIIDKTFLTQNYKKNGATIDLSVASENVWRRWNQFRLIVDFSMNFKVALELTPILPSDGDINRWFGEPIELIIIPSDLFKKSHNNNQIYLKEPFRTVCRDFMVKNRAHFVIRCNQDDPWLDSYITCLRQSLKMPHRNNDHECNDMNGPDLKLPLQPVNTVNNCTKYLHKMYGLYAEAIYLAIEDLIQSQEKINLMICGVNGWKLLEPAMSVIGELESVDVFVYEENACVRISINEAIEHLYAGKKITILEDAGAKNHHHKMDIVVSITSEAIYESQILKLNFGRVKNYIRQDAILIPRQSKLLVFPVTSAKVYSYLQDGWSKYYHRPPNGLEHYETRAQTVCPLYTRNLYECAGSKELFSFGYFSCNAPKVHVSSDTQFNRLEFTIDRDCIVQGFCGYLKAILYKDITLSNRTLVGHHNQNCAPLVYFPLKSAQTLKAQTKLEAMFWLNSDHEKKKIWYEWQITAPLPTATHNLKGKFCSLQYPMGDSTNKG